MVHHSSCWIKIWLLPLLIMLSGETYSQSNKISGIKFNSQNVPRNQKTSIFLNDGQPIELRSSFSISFDISFWDYRKFGPILRIDDEQGNEIRVVYNQFKNNDTSYIQIIVPLNEKNIEIKLPKKDLARNQWFNFKMIFDKKADVIKTYWNNFYVDKITYSFRSENEFYFTFGLKELNSPIDFDVPAISIKNILITQQGKREYFWSLNPLEDNVYTDKLSGNKLKIINPNWVYEDHIKWRKLADIKISDRTIAHRGVAIDSRNSKLFIDCNEKLIIYDLISEKDSFIKYKSPSPAYWNDLFYDNDKQMLYSYFTGMGMVSVYDLRKNLWITIDKSKNSDGHFFGSAKFSYPKSSDLYLLGGYGWYKSKNDLFKYNFEKKEWRKVKLKKNEMTPRAWFTFGKGFREGEYLIYGGLGNESGDQEQGFKSYHDLFLLNMNDTTITKLKLPEKNDFTYQLLHNYNYLDKADSTIYFLSQNEVSSGFNISLNSLSLKTGRVSAVANKFWERSAGKWMYSYLHYNKSTNELISLIFDSTKVEIFSINYPPISETEKTYFKQIKSTNYSALIIFASAGIGFAIIIVFYVRKRRTNHSLPLKIKRDGNILAESGTSTLLNSIQLFGGFHIYNNQGKDLISDFSPKLKEILLLILLRSFNHYQYKGITSEELSSIIWPDSSSESVKSSRGVAINKIRKLLSSVDGVDLEFSDKLWLIKINNGARCDYAEFLRFIDAAKNGNGQKMNSLSSLIIITQNGEFLKGISYEWLDSIKFSINIEAIKLIKYYFENEELKTDPEKTIRLCDIVLSFDSVDQDTIKLKIKTLSNQGKPHIAKSIYGLFIAEYKRLYDEHYPTTFDEMISS